MQFSAIIKGLQRQQRHVTDCIQIPSEFVYRRRAKGGYPFETPLCGHHHCEHIIITWRSAMAKKTDSKANKDIVVSLRLTEEEYSLFADKIEQSSLTRSAFFRNLIMSKSDSVNIEVKDLTAVRELLYIVNKSGNNINQLALRVNAAHKNGLLSDSKFSLFINVLINIQSLLKKAVEYANSL
jgi:hypothetical protein